MAEEKKEEQKVETTDKKVEDRALETGKPEEGVLAKILARNESQPPQTQNETKPDVPVVTEELVKEYPELKTLIGKPITEAFKSYSELNKRLSRSENELNTLKTKVPQKEPEKKPEEKPVQATKTVEEEIEELINSLPDPLDDPKGYARANLKIARLQTQLDTKPLKGIVEERQKSEEARANIIKATELVSQKLPEGVDMNLVQSGFSEFIAPVIAENPTMYHGKPDLLASDIAAWYYSEEFKRLKSGGAEDTRKKTAEELRDLKRKIEGKPDKETRAETVRSEDSGLSPTVQKIIERNEGKMPQPGVRGK